MAINTDYYGAESSWIPYSTAVGYKYNTYTSDPAAGAYTENSRGTLSDLYRSGRLLLNEYPDLSVCYAGMDPYADMCNVRYIDQSGVEQGKITAAGATPFYMAAVRLYNSSAHAASVIHYQSDSAAWGMDTVGDDISAGGLDNNDASIAPLVSIPGRAIVIHLCVLAGEPSGDTGITNQQLMSLDSFISDNTRTRVVGIYGIPMVYHGVDRYQYQSPRYSSTDQYPSVYPVTAQTCSLPERDLLHCSKNVSMFANGMFCISGRGGTAGSTADYYISIEGEAVVPVFGDIWHIYHGQSGSGYFKYISCYTDIGTDFATKDAFIEYAKKQAAYLGLFFTGDATIAASASDDIFSDDKMYLGIIDPDGITRGYYSSGAANELQPQYDPESDVVRDTAYDPSRPYDPNRYDTTSQLNRFTALSGFGVGAKAYAVDFGDVHALMRYLYLIVPNLYDPTNGDDYEKYFLNNNPIDLIVSLIAFPFDLSPYTAAAVDLTFGNQQAQDPGLTPGVPTAIKVNPFLTSTIGSTVQSGVIVLNAGSCTYFEHFGDFRDYQGSADLLIPYCGSVHIDPETYMGHTISVKYLVDLATGSCLALVYRDRMITDTLPGQIGVPVTLSGLQQADYINALHNARQQLLQANVSNISSFAGGLITAASGAAMGNPLMAAGGLIAAGRSAVSAATSDAEYKLDHTKAPIKTIGTAAAATSMINEQAVRLIITRPKMLAYDAAVYAHSVGYACYRFDTLSSYTGYTQVINADLSGIPATDTELQMIRQQLQNGVYL